jgi:multiple sugar transport system ATP-binding protein
VAEFIGSPAMNFIPVEAQVPSLVSHPEFRLALPSEWDPYLKSYEGSPLMLGIRPEHLSLALPAPKNIWGTVSHLEALGSETYLQVHTDSLSLTVKIPPDQVVNLGDEVWIAIAPEKAHLFDPATNQSLLSV